MSLINFGFSTNKAAVKAANATQRDKTTDNICREEQKRNYEKKRDRKFRKEWCKDFPWLHFDIDENVMHCSVCQDFPRHADRSSRFYLGNSSFRIHHIQSHNDSLHHRQCVADRNARDNPHEAPLNVQLQKIDDAQMKRLSNVFDLGYFIVKSELPFATFPGLMQISQKIGADVGQSYCSDNALRRFIPYMYEDLHEPLQKHLTSCRYISVLSDSSTDCSIRDMEVIYVRHLRQGYPTNSYIAIDELEHAHAQGHLDSVDRGMCKYGVENWKEKVIGFGSDGASVMIGRKNGVVALIKSDVPYLIGIHCLAHKLELAAVDAIKDQDQMQQITEMLDGIYQQYHYSPKAWRELQNIAELINEDVQRPVNLKGTRWLPHITSALSALLKGYGPMLAHFEHTVEQRTSSAAMQGRARKISRLMRGFHSLQFMLFMLDVLDVLSRLSCKFQENKVTLSDCLEALETTYLSLASLKFQPGEHQERFLSDSIDGKYRGVELDKFNDEGKRMFERSRDLVLNSICDHLTERFQSLESDELLAAARVTNLRDWPTTPEKLAQFGNEDITLLCDWFREILLRNGCDIPAVRHQEWPDLKAYIKRQAVDTVHDTWASLFVNPVLAARFSNIIHVIEIILVLPMSTATCERGFSLMKRLKSDWRSNLQPHMMHMLMFMSIEGPDCQHYEAERAMRRWWLAGERQRRPVE